MKVVLQILLATPAHKIDQSLILNTMFFRKIIKIVRTKTIQINLTVVIENKLIL